MDKINDDNQNREIKWHYIYLWVLLWLVLQIVFYYLLSNMYIP